MQHNLTRRDFLKAAAAFSLTPVVKLASGRLPALAAQEPTRPNVIIILFDAMSALHLSIHGYPRRTSPNFERLARRSIVYHAHHSAANFTTPSTASLFTGVYPWTHRVFTLGGMPHPDFLAQNMWKLLEEHYYQSAFVQNIYADVLLFQLQEHLDRHLGPNSFSLAGRTFYDHLFPNDMAFAAKSYDQFLFNPKEKPGSFFLSIPIDLMRQAWKRIATNRMIRTHPDGLSFLDGAETLFALEDVMGSVKGYLESLPEPFLSYIHILPPHTPYRPDHNFLGMFEDGWTPPLSKKHRLADGIPKENLKRRRQVYDEYIANVDSEFGKLLDSLESSGTLENAYLIVTSDHGDFFEKGEQGHVTPLLFEPVIRVPLLISTPGRSQRRDVYSTTSNVDILPTLLKISGIEIPDFCEGRVLPELGGEESTDRSIFAIEAKKNSSFQPLKKATIAMIQGKQKIIRYMGYRDYEGYEFFDLDNDPEENKNNFESHPAAKGLQRILDLALEGAEAGFR